LFNNNLYHLHFVYAYIQCLMFQEGSNFSVCACCSKTVKLTVCKLVSGTAKVAPVNVTYS
jgi:hypothetical protein